MIMLTSSSQRIFNPMRCTGICIYIFVHYTAFKSIKVDIMLLIEQIILHFNMYDMYSYANHHWTMEGVQMGHILCTHIFDRNKKRLHLKWEHNHLNTHTHMYIYKYIYIYLFIRLHLSTSTLFIPFHYGIYRREVIFQFPNSIALCIVQL